MKEYKDRRWLLYHYKVKGLPTTAIAEMCDVSAATVTYFLRKFRIEIHKRGRAPSANPCRQLNIRLPEFLYNSVKVFCDERGDLVVDFIKRLLIEHLIGKGRNPFKEKKGGQNG